MELTLPMICDELGCPLSRYDRPRTTHTLAITPAHLAMRGARLLQGPVDASALSSELLYIASAEQLIGIEQPAANILCVGTPHAVLGGISEYRIVELASGASPDDVFDAVLKIFERYSSWHDDFARAIMSRAPLQELLEIGCRLFRNPVSFANPALENLALAGAPLPSNIEGSIWETIVARGYSPFESIELDERDELIAEIESHHSPYLSRPQQAYSDNCFLIAPVDDGSRFLPALASTDICEPYTDGQIDLIAHIARGVEAYLSLTSSAGQALDELALVAQTAIVGDALDAGRLSHALGRYRWSADDDYALVCVPNSETALVDVIDARASGIISELVVVRLEGHLALVVNCSQSDDGVRVLDKLDAMLADMGLRGGTSYVTKGFSHLDRAFEQARIAASAAIAQGEPGLLSFAEHHARCVIHLLEQQTSLDALVHPAVLALRELERGATLVDTLACYLRHDCNASRTARELYLHRSTLAYRLDQIESATGLALKELSGDETAALLMSCAIVQEDR